MDRIDRLRSIEELRAVHRASICLQHTLDPQELAAETIRVLESTLGYEFAAVLLIDGASDRLTPFALSDQELGAEFVGADREHILSYDVRLGHGITGWVAANGKTVRTANATADPRYLGVRSDIMSELCVPMWVRGRLIGVVNVETSRPNAYTESDERVLEIIASQFAIAIENSRLHQALVHSQRLDAIGRLTSGIAHDFNNLLTVITGYADMILGADDLDETIRQGIEQIKIAGDQSAAMTQQLLAFSRKTVLRTTVVNPNDEIDRLKPMLGRLLGREIQFSLEYEPVNNVEVDPTQFGQVLVNLAVNARDAMPDGGTFSIATSTALINERSQLSGPRLTSGRYTVISITDSGHGMNEATRQSVFEPFFSTKEGGTGLGLAMAYGAIRQSNGRIYVASQPGNGARFSIYLPAVTAYDSTTPSVSLPTRSTNPQLSYVMVVDDDEAIRNLVAAYLKRAGYNVVTAESGEAALDIALQKQIEMVVSDVVMPGIDGPTLVSTLRKTRPNLKVLFISGYPSDKLDSHGAFAEPDCLLAKPFTRDTLLNKMREMLPADQAFSRPVNSD